MKTKLLLSGIALLACVACQKEDPTEHPQPQTDQSVNHWRCTEDNCNSPLTCTNQRHEICSTCGISRRPPKGCICSSGENPTNPETGPLPPGYDPGPSYDPWKNPYSHPEISRDLININVTYQSTSPTGRADMIMQFEYNITNYGSTVDCSTSAEEFLLYVSDQILNQGKPIYATVRYTVSGVTKEHPIIVTGYGGRDVPIFTYIDCYPSKASYALCPRKNVLTTDSPDSPFVDKTGIAATTYTVVSFRTNL